MTKVSNGICANTLCPGPEPSRSRAKLLFPLLEYFLIRYELHRSDTYAFRGARLIQTLNGRMP